MLGSINKFLLKYPGLSGAPFYLFLIAAIGASGSIIPGAALFYTNVFNALAQGFIPGMEVIAKEAVLPALNGVFNVASGAVAEVGPLFDLPTPGL